MTAYADNMEALWRRWPRVTALVAASSAPPWSPAPSVAVCPRIDGRLLVSSYDRKGEARTQAGALIDEAKVGFCYGVGLGDLPRALLERPQLQRLAVVSLSAPILRLALELEDQRDWLMSPRVMLMHGAELTTVRGPAAVVAGELRHAEPSCTRLRDDLVIELNRRFFGVQFESQREEDQANVKRAEAELAHDEHVHDLLAREKRPGAFIVCAGGPSLDQEIAWVRDCYFQSGRDLYRIVSVNTAVPALSKAGIVPDYVVVLDSHPNSLRHLEGVDPQIMGGALVYDRAVPTDYMHGWRGRRAWARSGDPGDVWADGTVTHMAVDLAVQLGATSITLVGADFCYPDNLTHHRGVFHSYAVEDGPNMIHTQDGHGRDVLTISSLVHMRRRLERYIASRSGVAFYKRGRAGVPLEGATWVP